jgi:hypothetical protein
MRNQINLFAFAATLAGAGGGHLARPDRASATMAPPVLDVHYCCDASRVRCCGVNWCAITVNGCAVG